MDKTNAPVRSMTTDFLIIASPLSRTAEVLKSILGGGLLGCDVLQQADCDSTNRGDIHLENFFSGKENTQILACYEAPWEIQVCPTDMSVDQLLANWLVHNRNLLKHWHLNKGRMVLINVGRLSDSMAGMLEMLSDRIGCDFAPDVETRLKEIKSSTNVSNIIRAKLLEWVGPEYWEVYEALESCAWLGNRSPEFRGEVFYPADIGHRLLFNDWDAGLKLPLANKRIHDLESEFLHKEESWIHQMESLTKRAAENESLLAERNIELEMKDATLVALQQKEKLLQERVAKFEQDIESQRLMCQSQAIQLKASQQDNDLIQEKMAALESQLGRRQAESDTLLLQLHTAQNELEQALSRLAATNSERKSEHAEFDSKLKNLNEQLSQSLAQLKAVAAERELERAEFNEKIKALNGQVVSLYDELKSANERTSELENQIAEHTRNRAAHEKKHKEELTVLHERITSGEAEFQHMQNQLHQVQSEFERQVAVNQKMAAALATGMTTFARAREVVSSLMARI